MFRTIITFVAVPVLTTGLGMVILTFGLVLPARWCFDPIFRIWGASIMAAAGVRLSVDGADRLDHDREYFFVSNHQSALDIPILALITRGKVRFLAKKSLFRIPFLGWVMYFNDFVPIDRSSARRTVASLKAMTKRMEKRPISLGVFPEGTRSCDGSIAPFKRGSMQVGKRSGLPIVPIAINGSIQVHLRDTLRIQAGPVRVAVGEPISADEVKRMSPDDLMTRLESAVSTLFDDSRGADAAARAKTATKN